MIARTSTALLGIQKCCTGRTLRLMASSNSPTGSVRRQGRNISHPLARRTTRGPLDTDDPLGDPSSSASTQVESARQLSPQALAVQSKFSPSPAPASPAPPVNTATSDLHFLQDRGTYHALSSSDIPPAFLDSPTQPPAGTALPDLLERGFFRRAAETAVTDLLQCQPGEPERLLRLFYTRLACLILISRPDLAAQEAFPLTDLLSRPTSAAADVLPLIPWELRILAVRLQSIGASDGGRRGIMALYALAGEARVNLKQAHDLSDEGARKLWDVRLQDLALRAVDTLVEMGELETASRHLDTLSQCDAAEIVYRKALLRLRVGDLSGAEGVLGRREGLTEQQHIKLDVLRSVMVVAREPANAAETWQDLQSENQTSEDLCAQNLAVALLYQNKIQESRRVLEELSKKSSAFTSLIFNLTTVYELCTERAIDKKRSLASQMASKMPVTASEGWERANVEFKL